MRPHRIKGYALQRVYALSDLYGASASQLVLMEIQSYTRWREFAGATNALFLKPA